MNIIILLGSNLGDRLANLQQAIASIASFSTILHQSNIYQTAAWGNTDQADFLNQAIEIQTHQTAENLMHALLAIESQMGRVRLQKWEPRIIDLDIIFYDVNYNLVGLFSSNHSTTALNPHTNPDANIPSKNHDATSCTLNNS